MEHASNSFSPPPFVDVDYEKFRDEGFLLLPGVFSVEEWTTMRDAILKRVEAQIADGSIIGPPGAEGLRVYRGELILDRALRDIVFDGRLLSVAGSLLAGNVSYYGDASIHYGLRADEDYTARGLHRDCPSLPINPDASEWSEIYPLIRMGLYFQNHETYAGGLSLVPGSHRDPAKTGPLVPVLSHPGDVVVWDQRILHVGHTRTEGQLDYKNRLAAFLSYGSPSPQLQTYLQWMSGGRSWMGDNVITERWKNTVISEESRELMAARKVSIYPPFDGYGEDVSKLR